MPYADKEKQRAAQRKYEAQRKKKGQHAIWWGYLYPESAPEDWVKRFRESGFEGLACIHDKDVTATGEVKKAHAHVALRFSHAVTREKAVEALSEIGVLEASVQYRDNWRAVARYLIHADDPDKAQYDPDDVVEVGGADFFDAIHRTSDKYRTIADMQDFIDQNSIMSFAEFNRWCRKNEPEWFYALCDNCAVIIREYIKSCRYDYLESK